MHMQGLLILFITIRLIYFHRFCTCEFKVSKNLLQLNPGNWNCQAKLKLLRVIRFQVIGVLNKKTKINT